jgi:FKBP-type peptidyl-prolyl cis-trans isomerase FkpA
MKKDRATNPTWLKLAVMLFIGYAIFINYTERQERKTTDSPVLGVTAQQAGENPAVGAADFGSYILPKEVTIGGDIAGSGEEASCGQTATLTYSATNASGTALEGEAGKDVALQVGMPHADKPWAAALVGMRQGGVRQVNLPATARYDEAERSALKLMEGETLRYKVELSNLTPQSSAEHISFQATDRFVGQGEVVTCGAVAELHVRVWGEDGKPSYDSRESVKDGKPLTLEVGSAELLYGLDRGVLGMRVGGQRTLLIPPAFATLGKGDGNPLKEAILKDSMLVAEILLVGVKNK